MVSKKVNPVWSFLSSVKLTICLLVVIALLAVVGTFIPQQEGAAEFLSGLSPETANLLVRFQICDIYHSLVFYLLMSLLSLNLIVCSLNRFPVSRKKVNAPGLPVSDDLFIEKSPESILYADMAADAAVTRVEGILKEKFKTIQKDETNGKISFFTQKGRFSHLGVYVVHLSVLLLIAGAVIGSLFGFEAFVYIDEGQSVQEVTLKGKPVSKTLDFAVRCDKFTVAFYNNGAPKTYRSDLSFIRNDRIIRQGSVLVNHPLTFEGIRFYQSSYGPSPDKKAFLSYTGKGGQSREMALSERDVFELPESQASVTILRVEENIMEMGPAVKLNITTPDGDIQFWVFQHIEEIKNMNPGIINEVPMFNPGLFEPYVFFLHGVEQKFMTGLQVVRDPGVPVVAIGGLLMIAGLMMTFWMPHRRFWILIAPDGGKTAIQVAGKSSRNPEAFAREMNLIRNAIKESIAA